MAAICRGDLVELKGCQLNLPDKHEETAMWENKQPKQAGDGLRVDSKCFRRNRSPDKLELRIRGDVRFPMFL